MAGAVAAVVGSGLVTVGLGGRAMAETAASALLDLAPVPVSKDDTVVVPAGYKVQVLAPWGTPILEGAPAYAPGAVTGAAPAGPVGTHHDGMHFFPVEGSSTDGLLVMTHEYAEARFFHAAQCAGQALDSDAVVTDADGKRVVDDGLAEINGHGVSVLRIRRGANWQWAGCRIRSTAASGVRPRWRSRAPPPVTRSSSPNSPLTAPAPAARSTTVPMA
jgi:hypothetical protein